jgi:DNA-binding winged helix-turn-helix (wHTH) protein
MRAYFEHFVLDLEKRELFGQAGPLHLSGKAFALLEQLVRNAPKALSKEELYSHLWGDTFVDEANIANLIFELRSALGDDKKKPRFIRTMHRFGYRFDAPIRWEQANRGAGEKRRCWLEWRSRELPLSAGENIIGRDATADVTIESAAVSRRHARINVGDGGVTLEDLGSKNGTFVDDERLAAALTLTDGKTFRLGSVPITFRYADVSETTMTEAE